MGRSRLLVAYPAGKGHWEERWYHCGRVYACVVLRPRDDDQVVAVVTFFRRLVRPGRAGRRVWGDGWVATQRLGALPVAPGELETAFWSRIDRHLMAAALAVD